MRICVVILGLCLAALSPPIDAHAQNSSPGGWLIPDWNKPAITAAALPERGGRPRARVRALRLPECS